MTAPPTADSAKLDNRRLAIISMAGTALFLCCTLVAAAIYPGGSFADRSSLGHSFWRNYLCDLMHQRALNGSLTTLGAILAKIGMAAMFVTLGSFFVQIARSADQPTSPSAQMAARAGILSCMVGGAVPLLPSDQFPRGHAVAVICAFAPSVAATIAAARISWLASWTTTSLRGAAFITVFAGLNDGLLYILLQLSRGSWLLLEAPALSLVQLLLPILQRLASLGLLVWVLLISLQSWHKSTGHTSSS